VKKICIVLSAGLIIMACGGGESKEAEKKTTDTPAVADISKNPDYQKGLEIESKQDCVQCHRIDEKVQGPSYREIANKYAGADTAVEYLSKKIMSGGYGVWGEIMMAPHPMLSKEDAESIVKYILLLKK
jgi:cytochrome c